MNSKLTELLVIAIKSKAQIKTLEDSFVEDKLNKFFLTHGDLRKQLEEEFSEKQEQVVKSKKFKKIIKAIRDEIGQVYGQFLTSSFGKKEKLIQKANSIEECNSILKLHKSTRERLDYYKEIYSKVFSWHKPQKIADLACGLNPLSYLYMKDVKYIVCDLNPSDMHFIQNFFDKFKIKGKAFTSDLTTLEILENKEVQSCDLVFLFKALDSLESVRKNISKDLLEGLKAKHIVVSFPTKSVKAKASFNMRKRNWFFRFLDEKKWSYECFEVENELFVLISQIT